MHLKLLRYMRPFPDLPVEASPVDTDYDPSVWQKDLISFKFLNIFVPTIARQLRVIQRRA